MEEAQKPAHSTTTVGGIIHSLKKTDHRLANEESLESMLEAISRARGKLIVVAHRERWRSADVSTHNRLLSQLVFGGVAMKVVSPMDVERFKMKRSERTA